MQREAGGQTYMHAHLNDLFYGYIFDTLLESCFRIPACLKGFENTTNLDQPLCIRRGLDQYRALQIEQLKSRSAAESAYV